MEITGLPIVTVGEQRASSFAAHPLIGNLASEPREQFRANLCDEAERDIRQALAAGAARMSIDFHRGSLVQQERVGAEKPVRPAQATSRYSRTSPPRRSVRCTLAGLMSSIGAGSESRAAGERWLRDRWGRCEL